MKIAKQTGKQVWILPCPSVHAPCQSTVPGLVLHQTQNLVSEPLWQRVDLLFLEPITRPRHRRGRHGALSVAELERPPSCVAGLISLGLK